MVMIRMGNRCGRCYGMCQSRSAGLQRIAHRFNGGEWVKEIGGSPSGTAQAWVRIVTAAPKRNSLGCAHASCLD
jgi:hypothetical protein